MSVVAVGAADWEPPVVVELPVVGSLAPVVGALLDAEAVGVGDCEVADALGLADVVLPEPEGVVLVPPPLLLPPPDAGVVGSVLTGMPPCSVTTIPPGLNTICAAHWPLGAALVAVAVTTRLCPAASVPEP